MKYFTGLVLLFTFTVSGYFIGDNNRCLAGPLPNDGTLYVNVRDIDSHDPIRGARVQCTGTNSFKDYTNSKGVAKIKVQPHMEGEVYCKVQADGYAPRKDIKAKLKYKGVGHLTVKLAYNDTRNIHANNSSQIKCLVEMPQGRKAWVKFGSIEQAERYGRKYNKNVRCP